MKDHKLEDDGELLSLEENAGSLCDYDCKLIALNAFLYYLLESGYVKCVDLDDVLNANCSAELSEIDSVGLLALESLTGGRVLLVAGHTGGAVVEYHYCTCGLVVSHIDKGVDTCM